MTHLKNRKGSGVADLPPAVMALVLVGVLLGLGGILLGGIQDTVTTNTTQSSNTTWNVLNDSTGSLVVFGSWLDLVVIVLIIGVMLGLVMYYFSRKG